MSPGESSATQWLCPWWTELNPSDPMKWNHWFSVNLIGIPWKSIKISSQAETIWDLLWRSWSKLLLVRLHWVCSESQRLLVEIGWRTQYLSDVLDSFGMHIWLVVTGTCFIFPFSWECHHPNGRTHIFQRCWNHQPDILILKIFETKRTKEFLHVDSSSPKNPLQFTCPGTLGPWQPIGLEAYMMALNDSLAAKALPWHWDQR